MPYIEAIKGNIKVSNAYVWGGIWMKWKCMLERRGWVREGRELLPKALTSPAHMDRAWEASPTALCPQSCILIKRHIPWGYLSPPCEDIISRTYHPQIALICNPCQGLVIVKRWSAQWDQIRLQKTSHSRNAEKREGCVAPFPSPGVDPRAQCCESHERVRLSLPVHGGTGVPTSCPSTEDPQMCPLQEPRGALLAERTQALLPLQGLLLWEMYPYHWEAEGHGSSGGTQEAASQREPGKPHTRYPEVYARPANHSTSRHQSANLQTKRDGHPMGTGAFLNYASTSESRWVPGHWYWGTGQASEHHF